ncbi:MAG: LysM peptidoglycan-binding domain-containing protein [Ignavibacterium sp.]|nr:LysM peptidoglycan-binding domain-containing protein [Ignavibacterium sp.]
MKLVKVKKDETLYDIAEKEYGNKFYAYLLAQFNKIKFINNVYPNFQLWIPSKEELNDWLQERRKK